MNPIQNHSVDRVQIQLQSRSCSNVWMCSRFFSLVRAFGAVFRDVDAFEEQSMLEEDGTDS